VVLDRDGERFVRANAEDRKEVWREQLLKLRLFKDIYELLKREPEHAIDRDFVYETIIMAMPHENYEKLFNTFVRWARFGDLFAYDETTETLTLQEEAGGGSAPSS
jgi:NitT/TauT family transport system ATP-binding protein